MRKVTFGVGNSLDNYIARTDGAVDWLTWTPEVSEISSRYWQTIDTVVMGRLTYEAARKHGTSSYPGVKNIVFSRTLKKSPDPNVEIVSGDAVEYLRALKAEDGKGICVMGGGLLAQSLLAADLIDEIGVNVHPVLLGSGIPLFGPSSRQVDLELAESRVLANGCVYCCIASGAVLAARRRRPRGAGNTRRTRRSKNRPAAA